ncbi:MAG: Holliday junction DNA helicase RuvA [Parcubacteria group bacterium CG2_30_44_11]|nr:MAG: Holliday junction DNA helicase RuvA [Parcubacteria group bacterium CG2_30_44_11]
MIRSITGTVIATTPGAVVVDVHGIGYLIHTNQSHEYSLKSLLTFHTHLSVRETALDLYGFPNRDDLEVFELLLTIPKIGPKSALEILTKADVLTLKNAILSNDPSYLSKVSGIGKKTAEKIVMGLKNSLDHLAGSYRTTANEPLPNYIGDAIDALVSLGYPPIEARKAVLHLAPTITTANEAVREALKLLGQT